jgi:cell division protein FtsA
MANQTIHAVGLDIGTSKVRCVIGELGEQGLMEIVGKGESDSRGLRRGVVTKTDAVIESVKKAVEDAERMSGLEVQLVTINLSGEHLRGENKNGVVAVAGAGREITADDVERAIESASAMQLPAGWEIVDKLPQEYIVDGQDGITEPIGMRGARLESKVHVVISPGAGRQNAIKAVHRAGLEVEFMMLEQLAAAESSLTEDDKEYGSALINIGAEITGLVIYHRGAVQHTAVFPFGGAHFTKDIAVGLRASIPDAEKIKRDYGCVAGFKLSEHEKEEGIEITPVGREQVRQLSRQILCDMLQPRAEELLQHIADEVKRSFAARQLSSGVILTGGGAQIRGLVEIAEQIFDAPTRLGYPERDRFGGLIEDLQSPSWTVASGLALVSMRTQMAENQSTRTGKSSNGKIFNWWESIKQRFG